MTDELREEATCGCGEMEYCPECLPAPPPRVTRVQYTEHHFEVRVAEFGTSDEFRDEGDAQELAVHLARKGRQPQIFKRAREVTTMTGEWEQIPAITPAEADEMTKQAESGVSL